MFVFVPEACTVYTVHRCVRLHDCLCRFLPRINFFCLRCCWWIAHMASALPVDYLCNVICHEEKNYYECNNFMKAHVLTVCRWLLFFRPDTRVSHGTIFLLAAAFRTLTAKREVIRSFKIRRIIKNWCIYRVSVASFFRLDARVSHGPYLSFGSSTRLLLCKKGMKRIGLKIWS